MTLRGNPQHPLGLDSRIIERIRAVFASFPRIEEAVVFGSRAEGSHKDGSDIDIAIRGNRITLQDLNRISDALDALLLPYTFDITLRERIDNRDLIDHIDRVGKVVYRRPIAREDGED